MVLNNFSDVDVTLREMTSLLQNKIEKLNYRFHLQGSFEPLTIEDLRILCLSLDRKLLDAIYEMQILFLYKSIA